MIKIQLHGTTDPLERLLMRLVEDWDELERWAFRYYSTDEKAKIARAEKDKLLAKLQEIREAGEED